MDAREPAKDLGSIGQRASERVGDSAATGALANRARGPAVQARSPQSCAIFPTPSDRLVDREGRPYFLWDVDWTLEEFRARLAAGPSSVRDALLAKLMRQAKPDDVLLFVDRAEVASRFEQIATLLGDKREFWAFWAERWRGSAEP